MKANTYRLKPGTTMQDILSIPGVSKGMDKDIGGKFHCLYNRILEYKEEPQ